MRHVVYDTNWWKSFVHARLAVSMGDRGCLSLFGSKPETHRLFAEQVTADSMPLHFTVASPSEARDIEATFRTPGVM